MAIVAFYRNKKQIIGSDAILKIRDETQNMLVISDILMYALIMLHVHF